jgi:hypothetical protein
MEAEGEVSMEHLKRLKKEWKKRSVTFSAFAIYIKFN